MENTLLKSIVLATPANVELEPDPIPQQWILSGSPKARSKILKRSRDWTTALVVWDCTAGSFQWHYGVDESILVISGEAILLGDNGEETRFGTGDVGFFPAGTSCSWRVENNIRKVAVLRETMWPPFGLALKLWKKFLRTVGLAGKSPLLFALAATSTILFTELSRHSG
jgi:uncharacterized protein